MTAAIFSRRYFLIGTATSLAASVSGCVWPGREASSDHAGRRVVVDGPVQPLIIDPVAGLSAVNAVRANFALAPFAQDTELQNAAQTHADLMADSGNYGHEFGPATKFPKRLAAAGFDGSAGENLGVGYRSIDAAVKGWLDSPDHRKIMLRPNYDRAGFAYAFNRSGRNERYTHFWVLIVGRRAGGAGGGYLRAAL